MRLLAASSVLAVVLVLAVRILGPSDAWDQTQPRTIAYTVDILVNGRWWLPVERETFKATKPPLYNWLAAPAVKVLGLTSGLAHKLPSVAALVLCWLAVARWGPRLVSPSRDPAVGWLAGMMLVVNYTMFKLGYLARPDMLLTLWLLLGWMAGTALLADAGGAPDTRMPAGRRRALALGFWTCVGLAGLTKGPALLPLLIWVVVAAPLAGRGWRSLGALHWWWGLPLGLGLAAAWVIVVWRIDPEHVWEQLWKNEIAGRLTCTGPEGSRQGPGHFLKTAPDMVLYYLVRFGPWSILSILAAIELWRRDPETGRRRWRGLGPPGFALHGGALFVIVTIVFYTLSASKRADYIAASFGPGALLAAWWLREASPRGGRRLVPLAPAAAAVVLAGLAVYNELEVPAPRRGFGDALDEFACRAEQRRRAEPMPAAFWRTGGTHLESFLGDTGAGGWDAVAGLVDAGEPFWLFAGRPGDGAAGVESRLERRGWRLRETLRSGAFPRTLYWPQEVVMYRVDPPEG